jgi:arylsulfatase A-like enzyme
VISQYEEVDRAVGRLVAKLVSMGQYDTTAIFLVSDHGLSKTDRHFCVNTFLKKHGLPAFYYPRIFDKKGKLAANMVSGNGMTGVYFKNAGGWRGRTTKGMIDALSPTLMDDLLCEEAVDIVCFRNGDGTIGAMSRRGRAAIKLSGDDIEYRVDGADPFGYAAMPQKMTSRDALKLTINTDYPDAPYEIAHLMSSPRSGDLIISATPGFDLRLAHEDPEHFSSHGSLHRLHMHVPIVSNVKFNEVPARTVDVFPTVFDLLGETVPRAIDGVSMISFRQTPSLAGGLNGV